jgi:hypothetical protein
MGGKSVVPRAYDAAWCFRPGTSLDVFRQRVYSWIFEATVNDLPKRWFTLTLHPFLADQTA